MNPYEPRKNPKDIIRICISLTNIGTKVWGPDTVAKGSKESETFILEVGTLAPGEKKEICLEIVKSTIEFGKGIKVVLQTFSDSLKFFGNEHCGCVFLKVTDDNGYVIITEFKDQTTKNAELNHNNSFSHYDRSNDSFVGISSNDVSYNLVDSNAEETYKRKSGGSEKKT